MKINMAHANITQVACALHWKPIGGSATAKESTGEGTECGMAMAIQSPSRCATEESTGWLRWRRLIGPWSALCGCQESTGMLRWRRPLPTSLLLLLLAR